MYILILLNPLFSFLSIIFLGRLLGRKGSILLSIFCISLSLFFSLFLFINVLTIFDICYLHIYTWIVSGLLEINFSLVFDSLTVIMLLLILIISLIVHIYSINYMENDPHLPRFLSFLSLFTFFMILLVTSSNFIQLFFGWEGVGVCSYLLISFWYMRLEACKSAIKAIIFNKIGDCSLLLAIGLIFYFSKSLNYEVVFCFFYPTYFIYFFFGSISIIDLLSIFLLVASIGKSAQFLLHPWLADAMEGPTPVSALIHAATMVTAGVFLIIRCSFLISLSTYTLLLMLIIGNATILFSSFTALFQNDIKKIIAYSTCSQLGYMLVSCSFLNFKSALFHLFNHGFFKALLFLSAGLLIHNLSEEQDLRKFGGLVNFFPFIYIIFLTGSFSLMGFPFLTGFYSKDSLIERLLTSFFWFNWLPYLSYNICSFCIFLTSLYSIRLIYWIFFSEANSFKLIYFNIKNNNLNFLVTCVLTILFLLSIATGFFFFDLFLGLGSNFLTEALFDVYVINNNVTSYQTITILSVKYNEYIIVYPIKTFSIFFLTAGVYLTYLYLSINVYIAINCMLKRFFYNFYVFFNQAWFINYLNKKLILIFFNFSHITYYFDKSLLEIYGPIGLYNILKVIAKGLSKNQANDLFNYFWNIFSLVFFLFIIVAILVF